MSAPTVNVTVEPMVGGSLVYLPMAPSSPTGPPRGRVLIELALRNKSTVNVTAMFVSITFPGSTVTGGTRPMNLTIKPGETLGWEMSSGADHFIFDQAKAPTTAVVSVFFTGYTDPISITPPVTTHINPVPGGAYQFPSRASDLQLGEFWQMNGCTHNPGNHQMFGYDMTVWGTNHDGTGYSPLTTGGDPYATKAPNDSYRSYGKPVRAMADGEVLAIVNNCPDNPAPLYAADQATMQALLDAQRYAFWDGFPEGEGGNHLYVQHGTEIMLYAHLQKGSIPGSLVARKPGTTTTPPVPGSKVSSGQFLGRSGNSGNSTAPHLHIHAARDPYYYGAGRPIRFTDAWTIDNDVIMGPGNPPKPVGDPGGTWTALAGRGIPEGSTTDGTVRDSFLLPSGTPRWPEVVKLAVEENDYQGVFEAMRAKGMSPAWINTYTMDKGPFYFYTFFTVVFRPSLGADQPTFHGLDAAGYQQTYNDMTSKGYYLKQVESYFSFRQNKQLFAAIFTRPPVLKPRKDPRGYHAQTYNQHRGFYNAWTAEGFVPSNVSVVSVNGQLSYTALYNFVGSSATTGLDLDESMTAAGLQSKFTTQHANQSFMTYLKGYFHQGQTRYCGIWRSGIPDRKVRNDVRETGLNTLLSGQRRGGHLLQSVSGYQMDGDVAYAAIWEA